MTRTAPSVIASAASVALLSATGACGADPDSWAAYEAQVQEDCRAALEAQNVAVSSIGAVAHGSDDLGSFTVLGGEGDGWSATWLCRAPRGEGALTVELIELPPSYQVTFADVPSGAPAEAAEGLRD